MIEAYFDDSGTHSDSTIVVLVGVIGPTPEWDRFEATWKQVLRTPITGKPQLRRFHMTDCVNHTGEFEKYSKAETDLVIRTFRDIILAHNLHGRAIVVPRDDWDRLITGAHRVLFGDVEGYCVRHCVSSAANWVTKNTPDKQLKIIFDDGPQHVHRTKQITENLKKGYDGSSDGTKLLGPLFLRVEQTAPLQAADMFAWETYAYCREWFRNPLKTIRPHYQRLIESDRFFVEIMNWEKIETLARSFSKR